MRTALHYSIAQASLIITTMTAFQLAGVLIGGYLGDKFPKRLLSGMCMLMHALGLLFLTFATERGSLVIFAVLHGLAWGIRGPFMQALRADYFGRQSICQILGISGIIAAMGQFAGPLVAGALGDATGNYQLGFTVLALMAAAGSLLFLLAKKPDLPRDSATS
jgi:MFS family permease